MKYILNRAFAWLIGLVMVPAYASVSLDRTRAIFPGASKSISLTIKNSNTTLPYLAQAWLEDADGNKLQTMLTVLPPIQRLEPGSESLVKVQALPSVSLLPQDKETLFYFNLREVPPRAEQANVVQLAMQTRIKLFYRPASLVVEGSATKWQENMTLQQVGGKYQLTNPTPYYITIVDAARSAKGEGVPGFEPVMIEPKGQALLKLGVKELGQQPAFTYVDDYGGQNELNYQCSTTCSVVRVSKHAG